MPFSRFPDGRIAQRPFGGAGFPRTCYAADRTGHVLLHTLYEQASGKGITVYSDWLVLALAVTRRALPRPRGPPERDRAAPARFSPGRSPSPRAATAGSTCFRPTPSSTPASGIGVAYRAGVPSRTWSSSSSTRRPLIGTNILITEGGPGRGRLPASTTRGERFMERYAPRRWSWRRGTSSPGPSRRRSTRARGFPRPATSISTCATWAGRRSSSRPAGHPGDLHPLRRVRPDRQADPDPAGPALLDGRDRRRQRRRASLLAGLLCRRRMRLRLRPRGQPPGRQFPPGDRRLRQAGRPSRIDVRSPGSGARKVDAGQAIEEPTAKPT